MFGNGSARLSRLVNCIETQLLRGLMVVVEYECVVPGRGFLKAISDAFEARCDDIVVRTIPAWYLNKHSLAVRSTVGEQCHPRLDS